MRLSIDCGLKSDTASSWQELYVSVNTVVGLWTTYFILWPIKQRGIAYMSKGDVPSGQG